MTEQEAREAVKIFDCGCAGTHHQICNRIQDSPKYYQAKGFLEGLEAVKKGKP